MTNLYAGSLDEPARFEPKIAIFVSEKPPWTTSRAGSPVLPQCRLTMALLLPKPVEAYFRAENADRPEDLAACMAADAVVVDEHQSYRGLAAILKWKAETKTKYHHVMEPLEMQERDGLIVVKSRLTGSFPGSPITLDFAFTLDGEKIKSLKIG